MAYGKAEEIIVVRKWKVEKYMEQIYVQTEDLSVGYHKKVLLSDIALKVNKGEILVLIGPNGAGKSTLIKLLMKELDSTSGQMIVSGERLEKMKHRRVAKYRRKLGVVFQDFRLLKDRNVYENVAFAQRVVNRPTRVIRKRVPEVLQEVGLAVKYKSFPDELSGGEQQRVAIARALAKNPKLLLCDEPTGALDYHTSKEILKLIETVNQRYGNTIIMVTHNDAIKDMADRVVKLRDGMIRKNYRNEVKIPAINLEL